MQSVFHWSNNKGPTWSQYWKLGDDSFILSRKSFILNILYCCQCIAINKGLSLFLKHIHFFPNSSIFNHRLAAPPNNSNKYAKTLWYLHWMISSLCYSTEDHVQSKHFLHVWLQRNTYNLFIAAISNDVFFLSPCTVLELWGWWNYANVVHCVTELTVSSITLTACRNTQEISFLSPCVFCIALFCQHTQNGRMVYMTLTHPLCHWTFGLPF